MRVTAEISDDAIGAIDNRSGPGAGRVSSSIFMRASSMLEFWNLRRRKLAVVGAHFVKAAGRFARRGRQGGRGGGGRHQRIERMHDYAAFGKRCEHVLRGADDR